MSAAPVHAERRGVLVSIAEVSSGGVLWSHSRGVVRFRDAGELLRSALRTVPNVPAACGKGHLLTPENVRMDVEERRWRCRKCGCERASHPTQRG